VSAQRPEGQTQGYLWCNVQLLAVKVQGGQVNFVSDCCGTEPVANLQTLVKLLTG